MVTTTTTTTTTTRQSPIRSQAGTSAGPSDAAEPRGAADHTTPVNPGPLEVTVDLASSSDSDSSSGIDD